MKAETQWQKNSFQLTLVISLYIKKCSPNCITCSVFNNISYKKSNNTQLKIHTYNHEDTSFNNNNVIYCITWNECGKQYVGLMTRKIERSISEHSYHIKKHDVSSYLYDHFQNSYKKNFILITILDSLEMNQDKVILAEKELYLDWTINYSLSFRYEWQHQRIWKYIRNR